MICSWATKSPSSIAFCSTLSSAEPFVKNNVQMWQTEVCIIYWGQEVSYVKKSRIRAYRSKRIHHIIGLMVVLLMGWTVLVEIRAMKGSRPSRFRSREHRYTDEAIASMTLYPGKAESPI